MFYLRLCFAIAITYAALSRWLSHSEIVLETNGAHKSIMLRILHQCKLSVPWAIFSFALIWPIACGVCFALYGHNGYNDFPIPQWSSAIVGGACSLITCPFWAIITMVRVGERMEMSDVSDPNL
jgi:hypothetical protein